MSQTGYVLVQARAGAEARVAAHLAALPGVRVLPHVSDPYAAVAAVAGTDRADVDAAVAQILDHLRQHDAVTGTATCTPAPAVPA